jgi:hypothetical protein
MSPYYRGYHRIFRTPFSDRADMNPQSPVGCLLMIIVPGLLICSTYMAWWELRFLIQGRTTVGSVDSVYKLGVRRYSLVNAAYLEVSYTFTDEQTGRLRSEHDDLPNSWPRPEGKIGIQYIAGVPGGSRIEGHRHILASVFFVVSLAGSVVYGGLLWREARRAVRDEEAFESKRRRAGEG